MKKLLLSSIAALFLATGAAQAPSNAYELRCQTYYNGNQSYSRCLPWYSEQELYQLNQAGKINDLNRSSRGGTRRASGCVSSRARGRRFRRCNDKLRLPRMKINATLFALLLLIAVPANAERIDPADIWVIDGDTIQIYRQHPNVRLVGFNAPETRNAAC
jgi:hypothetical protein